MFTNGKKLCEALSAVAASHIAIAGPALMYGLLVSLGGCTQRSMFGAANGGCASALTPCGNECVDTQLSAENCGACNNMCAADKVCSAGQCRSDCVAGTAKCDDRTGHAVCVNLANDPAHCGDCPTACETGEVCSGGVCRFDCVGGTTIDEYYVDGLSLTVGSPRVHVFSYAIAREDAAPFSSYSCPVNGGDPPPTYVGSNYHCAGSDPGGWGSVLLFAGLPFEVAVVQTTEPIEGRLISDQSTGNEDIGVRSLKLYVR